MAGAIQAQPGIKQQTFIAGFCAGASPSAGSVGYQEECAPTLKASGSGTNVVPSVLCIDDEGGSSMVVFEDVAATLRVRMDGHPPLMLGGKPELFGNHGEDSRYPSPQALVPTIAARYGTGGGSQLLTAEPPSEDTFCISGNIVGRQDQNGGNGIGVQEDISYTITATDRHCIFSQQRSDKYAQNDVTSTQSARQSSLVADVTRLDCRNETENDDLCGTLHSGTDGEDPPNSKHPARIGRLIRRLTPLECERCQGVPDHWTDIPGASDIARYKVLGNSVAIPCVEHVLQGIAYFLRKFKQDKETSTCTSTPII